MFTQFEVATYKRQIVASGFHAELPFCYIKFLIHIDSDLDPSAVHIASYTQCTHFTNHIDDV